MKPSGGIEEITVLIGFTLVGIIPVLGGILDLRQAVLSSKSSALTRKCDIDRKAFVEVSQLERVSREDSIRHFRGSV